MLRLEFSHGVYEHLALDNRAGGCVGSVWGTWKNPLHRCASMFKPCVSVCHEEAVFETCACIVR